jgi:4-amino-4-deoxy-L-arabinose transferase-like glycosyltransferase
MKALSVESSLEHVGGLVSRLTRSLLGHARWEKAILIVMAPFLAFYNLDTNPRPWHDEGSYLSLAKTLVQDGVYAVRSSEGYQTFGAVQSVGPTVVLPIALSFKLWGIGLLQGRAVTAVFLLLTLGIFYAAGHTLFGRRTALFAVILLLASEAVGFLLYGRPAFGEVPALGFLLAGWFVWARGVRADRWWPSLLSGLLVGAAMVTKSQYVIVGFGTLALLVILDLAYYRQGLFKSLIAVGAVAALCVAAWWLWQMLYFGMADFQTNAAKMRELASQTTGFHIHTTVEAIKSLVGSGTGYFYFFWGFLALIYGGFLCIPRKKDSQILAFLFLFACVWLAYYTFWIIPWSRYLFPAAAITALFVAKLANDLLEGFWASRQELWSGLRQGLSTQAALGAKTLVAGLLDGLSSSADHPVGCAGQDGQRSGAGGEPAPIRNPRSAGRFPEREHR